MIKTKDLREGNYYIDINGEINQWKLGNYQLYQWYLLSGVEYYKEIEPIQITEEWMLKLGFEKGYDTKLPLSTSYHIPNKSQEDEVIFMADDDNNYFLSNTGGEGSIVQFIGKPFKFVHQIQNIYYDLINEELRIAKSKSL